MSEYNPSEMDLELRIARHELGLVPLMIKGIARYNQLQPARPLRFESINFLENEQDYCRDLLQRELQPATVFLPEEAGRSMLSMLVTGHAYVDSDEPTRADAVSGGVEFHGATDEGTASDALGVWVLRVVSQEGAETLTEHDRLLTRREYIGLQWLRLLQGLEPFDKNTSNVLHDGGLAYWDGYKRKIIFTDPVLTPNLDGQPGIIRRITQIDT